MSDMPSDQECHDSEMDAQSDRELVKKAQEGDLSSYDALVLKYNERLYAMVYHMTKNRDDAYDLVQVAFTKAYRSLHRFKGKSAFYTWLYSIAVNTTLNYLKKKKPDFSIDDEDNGILDRTSTPSSDYASDPRRKADLKILRKKMNDALMRLSEHHRTVVVLYDIQGIPQNEISKILGVSDGTVRSRLFYAHKQLQAELETFKANYGL